MNSVSSSDPNGFSWSPELSDSRSNSTDTRQNLDSGFLMQVRASEQSRFSSISCFPDVLEAAGDLLGRRAVASSGPTLGYRPSLDGLRGVAILCVFVCHLNVGFTSGNLGVDIFFVLSGFLITSLLLEEFREGETISLKQFYIRRALRLLPALFWFLASMVIYSWLFLPSAVMVETARFALYAVFYSTNWVYAFFGLASPFLAHLWSLAVEEQFYFLWPVGLSLFLRSGLSRRAILAVISVLIVVVCAHRIALGFEGARFERIYAGSDTRADSILVGCLIAMLMTWRMVSINKRLLKVLGAGSFLVILIELTDLGGIPSRSDYSFGLTILALSAGTLILQTMIAPNWLTRIFETGPLVWIGKLSYSLYLWHFFAIMLASSFPFRIPSAVLLALGFACASYYFIERPFLGLKARHSSHAISSASRLTTFQAAEELS